MALFKEDFLGIFYVYQVKVEDKWWELVFGFYIKVVGINGMCGQVIDFNVINLEGWSEDKWLFFDVIIDVVVYELYICDVFIYFELGIMNKGKFFGLVEIGIIMLDGMFIGLDYIVDFGVIYVYIFFVFDFWFIDESKLEGE